MPRTKPLMLYTDNTGDAKFGGSVSVTNLHMAHWVEEDLCGNLNGALATSATSSDNSPIMLVSGVTKENVRTDEPHRLADPPPSHAPAGTQCILEVSTFDLPRNTVSAVSTGSSRDTRKSLLLYR